MSSSVLPPGCGAGEGAGNADEEEKEEEGWNNPCFLPRAAVTLAPVAWISPRYSAPDETAELAAIAVWNENIRENTWPHTRLEHVHYSQHVYR